MYAVGKLSSYITQGVYSVSGPFHPFGGAVDIIVVQQQNGSFKSSPWYVRFGKFQGVLKTKEKVVTICVNGNKAGFHMYLDHKGEAYFTKDCDLAEGEEFELSPPSSGDEMKENIPSSEGEVKEKIRIVRFAKARSCNCDAGQGDQLVPLDNDATKIVSRNGSHRSGIFSLMFRSKSLQEDQQGSNVERVSSMEHAEIAADLLETKWSTNLESKHRRNDIHAEKSDRDENTADSKLIIHTVVSEKVSSHEGTDDNIQTTTVSGDHSVEVGIHHSPVATDEIGDDQSYCLSTNASGIESFDSHEENSGNDIWPNAVRHVHFEETISETSVSRTHVLELLPSETSDLDGKTKLMSESVTIGDDESDLSSGGFMLNKVADDSDAPVSRGDGQIIIITAENNCDGQIKDGSLRYNCEVESSSFSSDVTPQTHDTLYLNLGGGSPLEQCSDDTCKTSDETCEVTSKTESGKSIDIEAQVGCHGQDLELPISEDSSGCWRSQTCSPSEVELQYAVIDGSTTGSWKMSVSLQLPEEETCKTDTLGYIENQPELIEDVSGPICDSVCDGTSHISGEDQEVGCAVNNITEVEPCLQDRLDIAPDESRSSSENLEAEQFELSDIDSCNVKQINLKVNFSNATTVVDDRKSPSMKNESEEKDSGDTNHEECLDSVSVVSGSQTSSVPIPRSPVQSGETELLPNSLPIIRSQIHELERSDLLYPLSCSLDLGSDREHELLKMEVSSSLKLDSDSKRDVMPDSHTSQSAMTTDGSEDRKELSLCKNLLFDGVGADASATVFESNKIFEPQGMIAVEQHEKNFIGNPSGDAVQSGGSWRLWPFSLKKSKTINTVRSVPVSSTKEKVGDSPRRSKSLVVRGDVGQAHFSKKKVHSLTPTSEELASLNLNEGQNVVTFSFSTGMLGQQQVDARIYLWKWNTRIVISDVDGTITKSDVLGQFMPLVGRDWSQTGVAHLFSAIKENGYQLLFLSARAISQAHLTRQFLFNLKQDGKVLPDGPVVISPDGLFPSLYREVIRRAPHEFKISCLEDIKALFPPEHSPFYAGFGNRDTDEISYLKVGVPKGKIFIINPKGEVVVNRCVDTKSYTSLHALVNGMFPPTTAEQEDFNSWNYWKLPLPDMEI